MVKTNLNSWTSYCYRLKMLSQKCDIVWTRKLVCIYSCVNSWEDVNMWCLIRSKSVPGSTKRLEQWQWKIVRVAVLTTCSHTWTVDKLVDMSTLRLLALWSHCGPCQSKTAIQFWLCAFQDVFKNGWHTSLIDQRHVSSSLSNEGYVVVVS